MVYTQLPATPITRNSDKTIVNQKMQLRERKFVNYVEAKVRICRPPDREVVDSREKDAPERKKNELHEESRSKKIPDVASRATANEETSSVNKSKSRPRSKQRATPEFFATMSVIKPSLRHTSGFNNRTEQPSLLNCKSSTNRACSRSLKLIRSNNIGIASAVVQQQKPIESEDTADDPGIVQQPSMKISRSRIRDSQPKAVFSKNTSQNLSRCFNQTETQIQPSTSRSKSSAGRARSQSVKPIGSNNTEIASAVVQQPLMRVSRSRTRVSQPKEIDSVSQKPSLDLEKLFEAEPMSKCSNQAETGPQAIKRAPPKNRLSIPEKAEAQKQSSTSRSKSSASRARSQSMKPIGSNNTEIALAVVQQPSMMVTRSRSRVSQFKEVSSASQKPSLGLVKLSEAESMSTRSLSSRTSNRSRSRSRRPIGSDETEPVLPIGQQPRIQVPRSRSRASRCSSPSEKKRFDSMHRVGASKEFNAHKVPDPKHYLLQKNCKNKSSSSSPKIKATVSVLRSRSTGQNSASSRKRCASETGIKCNKDNKLRKKSPRTRKSGFDSKSETTEKAGESSESDDKSESDSSDEDDFEHQRFKSRRIKRNSDNHEEEEATPTHQKNVFLDINYQEETMMPSLVSSVPADFFDMQGLWSQIVENMTTDALSEYKKTLRGILTGRLSCLQPIYKLIPCLPAHLIQTHEKLYGLLCQSSGAYAFKNHQGTTLISRHSLTDSTQIGAHIMLECLDHGVIPFDVMSEKPILHQIQNYVRLGIKDMLQEIVEQLPKDRNFVSIDDIKESLSSRLFK